MKRALIVSTALAVLAAAGCSSDAPDQTTGSTDSRPTPSTLATATDSTDPPDPTVPVDTDPTDPTDPVVTTPGDDGRFGFARLSFFGDCAALLTYMQTEAHERVTAWGLEGGGYYGPGIPVDMAAAEDSAGGDASRVAAPAATTPAAQDRRLLRYQHPGDRRRRG